MRTVGLLFGVAILLLAGAVVVVFAQNVATPEILLTLLLIAGVITLLAALGGLVALLRQTGLIDPREALGLPAGSIRAVLALGLVLIFAMVSVFLVGNVGPDSERLEGLSAEQVQALPADRTIAVIPSEDGETSTAVVQVPTGLTEGLAQQLMTILGTLVTAVVAFYFGAATSSTPTDPRGRSGDDDTGLKGGNRPGGELADGGNEGSEEPNSVIVVDETSDTVRESAQAIDDADAAARRAVRDSSLMRRKGKP